MSLDGRVLWRYPWDGANGATTPVLSGGETVIVGATDRIFVKDVGSLTLWTVD